MLTFIVAEIGVNWNGDAILLENMIENAKKAGCNAVKFQSFDEKIVKDHPQSSHLLKSSVSKSNIELINSIAKKNNIEWFSTPMYSEAVEILDPYVEKFKIRFTDGENLLKNKTSDLFKKILETGKKVFVSTEINPKNCKFYDNQSIKWLYVIPKYPCNFTDLNFENISDFDGYSNHCPKIIAPLTAAILGAEIIEIHITSNKLENFIDNAVSFNYEELTKLVTQIRDVEKIKK